MGKKSKKVKESTPSTQSENNYLQLFEKPVFIAGFFFLLLIILVALYQPLVFEGLEPGGSDAISSVARTHQLKMWEEKTGHYPLWNPYMFGGMPTYHRFPPKVWSIDTVLLKLDFLTDWRIWYFLLGALGLFLLVKFFGLSAPVAMLAATAFILMPHFQALVLVGHSAKFRAIMWMPWVLLSFLWLMRKQNFLAMLLFSLALALQFRTQHYQIIFYTLLVILFTGIPQLYQIIKEKQWKVFLKISAISVGALLIAILVVAQNLFSIREYTPYSTRGGYAISIQKDKETEQDQKGVGFDYATNWSYSVSEWWNLVIPKFHGGTSSERYTGDAVSAWKNRVLPTYWGTMPFTQSYEYMGIIIIFFALIGVIFLWEKWEVKSLTFLTIFALMLSLGKNFDILYKLFFYYFPYFDKFRAPVMILTLVMFTVTLLAAFGLSFIMHANLGRPEVLKRLYFVMGLFVVLMVIPLALGSTFSLTHTGEANQYSQEVINLLKKVRLEMLINSSLLSLIFLLTAIISIWAVMKNWLRREYILGILLAVIITDFLILNVPYLKGKFVDTKRIHQQYAANAIDQEIMKDKSLYRVYPFAQLFGDVRWLYHHQSIGGYSPAKLQLIQEIVDNCLYQKIEGPYPINWNVINMLNAKYMILNQQINSPRLKAVAALPEQKLFAYQNVSHLPRAFFVGNYRLLPDGEERLRELNNPEFDPAETAILEEKPEVDINIPDSIKVEISSFTPEEILLKVYTDKQALLVLSEMHYPPGWHAVLNDSEQLKIYKTNHLLKSVIVPAGQHSIKFYFRPSAYYAGLNISLISIVMIYVLILVFIYKTYGTEIQQLIKNRRID
jgi:hypothetical protein